MRRTKSRNMDTWRNNVAKKQVVQNRIYYKHNAAWIFVLAATAGCYQSQALTWYCSRKCPAVSSFQCKFLYCDLNPLMVSVLCDCGSYTSMAFTLGELFKDFRHQCILQQSAFVQSPIQQQYGASSGYNYMVQPVVQSQYSAPAGNGNKTSVVPPPIVHPR